MSDSLREALEKIIAMNVQYAKDRYGDAAKAEEMACVRVARAALSAPQAAAEVVIKLRPTEIQSGLDRVKWAEGLIRQLPEIHDGRNSWLLNYAGQKHEADKFTAPPSQSAQMRKALEKIEYVSRKDSLTDHERLQGVRTVVCAELSRQEYALSRAEEGKESDPVQDAEPVSGAHVAPADVTVIELAEFINKYTGPADEIGWKCARALLDAYGMWRRRRKQRRRRPRP